MDILYYKQSEFVVTIVLFHVTRNFARCTIAKCFVVSSQMYSQMHFRTREKQAPQLNSPIVDCSQN